MFRNREDAALQLAQQLKRRPLREPVVLGIPRGGVVLGAVLADQLGADLDIVLARKLRAPDQPELALGAVSEDGEVYLKDHARVILGDDTDYLEAERRYQMAEIARRQKLFRQVRPRVSVEGRSVIVTDDGIATGSTMFAALHVVRGEKAHEVIVAVPVAPHNRLTEIRSWCDTLVCLLAPEHFWGIGQFYEDFTQVEDEEVLNLLRAHAPVA